MDQLLQEYINGNNLTIAQLYNQIKSRLFSIAYNYCHDKEISQDTVHDLFEKLISLSIEKRIEYFGRPGTNFEAYLIVIIKNKCLDAKKIANKREKILAEKRYLFNYEANNGFYEKFLLDGMRAMLNSLQPRERQVIQLHLEGFSNDEIASSLNITYNTVKNNIYESKKKLRFLWDSFMN